MMWIGMDGLKSLSLQVSPLLILSVSIWVDMTYFKESSKQVILVEIVHWTGS